MRTSKRKKTVLFDTLAYSLALKEQGIEHSDTFAGLLAEALAQNIYSKSEVDHMIERALKEFRRSIDKIEKKSESEMREFTQQMHEMQIEIERIGTRTITTIIGILGSLIVVVGAISTFSHALFH